MKLLMEKKDKDYSELSDLKGTMDLRGFGRHAVSLRETEHDSAG